MIKPVKKKFANQGGQRKKMAQYKDSNNSATHFNNGYVLDAASRKIIMDYHANQSPPYLISQLAKKFKDLEGLYSTRMPVHISGAIKKTDSGKYEILLNKGEDFTRRRFTAAHEFAHYLLHKKHIGDGIRDDALYRSSLSTLQEVEANKLAADILMPFGRIYELLDNETMAADLPSIFKVSNTDMRIRLAISEIVLVTS